jgi:two-component system sensor histidine kinase UhpB
LTNVARHSQADRVFISLDCDAGRLTLTVADDGKGFPDAAPPEEHGGLRSMRERAVLIGGTLTIQPGQTGGAEVRLELPAAIAVDRPCVED